MNGLGVGALLRASRLRCGEDLRDVARTLRIRAAFLDAIEDGRFADLPGPAYAVGFVRTYAEHLGLDAEEVVRRFKAEAADVNGAAELRFLSPQPESGIPGGAILFLGIILAVVAYGIWYVSTARDGFIADLVSPLPERLASLLPDDEPPPEDAAGRTGDPDQPADSGPASPAQAAPADEIAPDDAAAGEAPVEGTPPQAQDAGDAGPMAAETQAPADRDAPPPQTAMTEPDGDSEPAAETLPAPDTQADTQPAPEPDAAATDTPVPDTETTDAAVAEENEPTATPSTPAAPADEAVETPREAEAEAETDATPEEETAEATTDTGAPPTAETETPAATPAPQVAAVGGGRVYGSTAEGSRILVRARSDSWIQVRDDTANRLLVTRLLRAGDSYRVPDRPGLKLLTGNAGALEILVDGEVVPSVGPEGAVRRGVALDIERLREGTAVVQ